MLLNLPLELIEWVLLNLPYDDIQNICVSCKLLNEVVNSETFWEKLAKRHFGVNLQYTKNPNYSSIEDSFERNTSAKTFYKKALLSYGDSLNKVWQQTNYEYFGGLFKLLYHDYMLYLVRLDPPPYPFTSKLLQSQIICRVYVRPKSTDLAVEYLEDISFNPSEDQLRRDLDMAIYFLKNEIKYIDGVPKYSMTLSCDAHSQIIDTYRHWQLVPDDELKEQELAKRLGIPRDMARLRFRHHMQYLLEGHQLFEPINLDTSNALEGCPIRPGIFKATYGSHGIELIHVYHCQQSNQLVGWKITGDPNVPSGETSFIGYLDKPISHNRLDDGGDIDYFVELRNSFNRAWSSDNTDENFKIGSHENILPKPFILPKSFQLQGNLQLDDLKSYKFRFASQIQIARAMFQEPKYVDAHMIIFSENTLAVINIDLKSLKICHRVKEKLDGVVNYEDFLQSQSP